MQYCNLSIRLLRPRQTKAFARSRKTPNPNFLSSKARDSDTVISWIAPSIEHWGCPPYWHSVKRLGSACIESGTPSWPGLLSLRSYRMLNISILIFRSDSDKYCRKVGGSTILVTKEEPIEERKKLNSSATVAGHTPPHRSQARCLTPTSTHQAIQNSSQSSRIRFTLLKFAFKTILFGSFGSFVYQVSCLIKSIIICNWPIII